MNLIISEETLNHNELPINRIILGDAITTMKKFPKESVDLLFTDPPYNISQNVVIRRNGGKFGVAKDIDLDFGEWDHNQITPYDWVPVAYELLKPNGTLIFFYDRLEISCIAKWLQKEFNMVVRHIGVWAKTNPAPQARKVKWMNATEFFIIATKNQGTGHHYNYKAGQHKDYIITPICMGKERFKHPTQKPEKLAIPIVKWWSFPNDIVLDPFCGTGTFCYVAYNLGRKFIGIENNKEYIKMCETRLLPLVQQNKLGIWLSD